MVRGRWRLQLVAVVNSERVLEPVRRLLPRLTASRTVFWNAQRAAAFGLPLNEETIHLRVLILAREMAASDFGGTDATFCIANAQG